MSDSVRARVDVAADLSACTAGVGRLLAVGASRVLTAAKPQYHRRPDWNSCGACVLLPRGRVPQTAVGGRDGRPEAADYPGVHDRCLRWAAG